MNNPPAFPRSFSVDEVPSSFPSSQIYPAYSGMDLRDYMAAKALQGMLASGNLSKTMPDADIAECSYNLADSMLKAREQ